MRASEAIAYVFTSIAGHLINIVGKQEIKRGIRGPVQQREKLNLALYIVIYPY